MSHIPPRHGKTAIVLAILGTALAGPSLAAAAPPQPVALLSYADFADLADRAPVVVRAKVRKVAVVEPARAPGLKPGWARLFVKAQAVSLMAGTPLTGSALRYLADVPLDAKGRVPKLAKREVLVFADTVSGKPGELQLVAPDAQVLWSPEGEARLRGVLEEMLAAGAPARIERVQEAIYVPGNLAGEGETQMFLATADGEPASITVTHAPGQPPRWSVSFAEVVDATGEPPRRESLAWYRLACFLPRTLEPRANVSATPSDRAMAETDYAFVLNELGECPRSRR